MRSRAGCASIACLAVLTLGTSSSSLAQTTAADTVAAPTAAAPAPAIVVKRAGMASIGGAIGGSYFAADADYSTGAQPRLWFSMHFRYTFTPAWRAQVTAGYTWAGYDASEPLPFHDVNNPTDTNKGEVLAQVIPVTLQLQYTLPKGLYLYHLGAGFGGYRVWVENEREDMKDPSTFRVHRGVYPGVSAEIGVSHFFKEHQTIALEWVVGGDWIFAQDDEKFPKGFNSFLLPVHVRFGATYHFTPPIPSTEKPKPGIPAR